MSPSIFTEDNLVQKTTAEYLERELGWDSIYAYNNETFGPDGLLGRRDDREVVLERDLRDKLVEFNPGLPADAYNEAVRIIAETSVSQSIASANRDKYDLLRDGPEVSFSNVDGSREKRRLRVFDFDRPEANRFLCVRELWLRGDIYHRRADIVGFVNGIPLLFVECKKVGKDIRAGYEENYKDYRDTVPRIFHFNAFLVFGNGTDAKVGSITAKFEHLHDWKRLDESEPGVVDMATLLKGFCSKANFLDLFENFILFDDSEGEPKKIIAHNHQYLGVNRAIAAVRDRKARAGKLGVFWHTQGSGKSYSIAFFTRKIHRRIGGNFSFLMLTDRDDLDTQLYKTFAACGIVNNDRDPCRASSGAHLSELLTLQKAYIFSLIQKFNREVEPQQPYSERDDIIVVTDEAHRTQYGSLALNMRTALPNAGFIGFTGTPLFSDDQITRRVFGDYVSTYDFQRAVEDNATVPLYYDARGDKLGIAIGDLNARIAEKIEELEITDVDVEQRLEAELKRDYHVITADKRLKRIAKDFAVHYSASWECGKAMLICIDKITCVRMYDQIAEEWKKRIDELEADSRRAKTDQDELALRRQIEWMLSTRFAVVVSEEQGEVAKFKKWKLDIGPHRKLIKDGIEIPEELRDRPKLKNKQRMSLDDAFKEPDHPFRVAIVCAMWLTGFDVPSLSTLYLDKPLKAHTLMQAIARANRVSEGKNNGLVVDYCGILAQLRKALATFAGVADNGRNSEASDGSLDPTHPDEELLEDLAEAIDQVRTYLAGRGSRLEDLVEKKGFERNAVIKTAKEAVNENDETRKRFEIMCREVFKKYKACMMIKGIHEYRLARDSIDFIYKTLQEDRYKANIDDILIELQKVVDGAIEPIAAEEVADSRVFDISKIDFERLRKEFERAKTKNTMVQNLNQLIDARLRRMMAQNPLRMDYQKRYEEIVASYNSEKDRATIERTFMDLMRFYATLDEESKRASREGLDDESLAVFDLLSKKDLSRKDIFLIKHIATNLLAKLKADKLRIDHWRDKESSRDAVKTAIRDFLWDEETGLPLEAYDEAEVAAMTELVYQHVYRAYPVVPSPFYSGAA